MGVDCHLWLECLELKTGAQNSCFPPWYGGTSTFRGKGKSRHSTQNAFFCIKTNKRNCILQHFYKKVRAPGETWKHTIPCRITVFARTCSCARLCLFTMVRCTFLMAQARTRRAPSPALHAHRTMQNHCFLLSTLAHTCVKKHAKHGKNKHRRALQALMNIDVAHIVPCRITAICSQPLCTHVWTNTQNTPKTTTGAHYKF